MYSGNIPNSKTLILDNPESPKDFTYTDESLGQTSVTFTWTRGFNGGADQVFVIQYRQASTVVWTETLPIVDTQPQLNFTLNGLDSGMNYEAHMYARNYIGDSTFTEVILYKTISLPVTGMLCNIGTFSTRCFWNIDYFEYSLLTIIYSVDNYSALREP